MDEKISPKVIRQRKKKTMLKLLAYLAIFVICFTLIVHLFRTGIALNDVQTSTVDKGMIKITIPATGKIVPLTEEVIISPVSTKILEVRKKAGDFVNQGDTIIKLDLTTINTEVEKQNDELEMKRNKLAQLKVASQSSLSDMEMQIEIDEMQIQRMEVLLRNEIFLDSIGAGTSDKIKQAELELTVEKMKLEQLKRKYENLKLGVAADTKVLELDYDIALKNALLKNKMMTEAQVQSPRTATLTWVNDQIGSLVPEGTQLVIVSDLNHFKVEAEVSDSYGDKVHPGNEVIVKIANKVLSGAVSNVVPSVRNGMISFIVLLEDNANEILRSGLKVDLYVINGIREEALRIANRSYYVGKGEYELWVIKKNEVVKRKIVLGESNYDYVEVIDGLSEGETVIISDMSKYLNNNKLNIK